jgi:hypothetical protein
VSGGECKVFRQQAVEVCGLTQDDQNAIDENTEAGIAACRWRRPEPRVPSCEDLRAGIAALKAKRPIDANGNPPVKKKRSILDVLRRR